MIRPLGMAGADPPARRVRAVAMSAASSSSTRNRSPPETSKVTTTEAPLAPGDGGPPLEAPGSTGTRVAAGGSDVDVEADREVGPQAATTIRTNVVATTIHVVRFR